MPRPGLASCSSTIWRRAAVKSTSAPRHPQRKHCADTNRTVHNCDVRTAIACLLFRREMCLLLGLAIAKVRQMADRASRHGHQASPAATARRVQLGKIIVTHSLDSRRNLAGIEGGPCPVPLIQALAKLTRSLPMLEVQIPAKNCYQSQSNNDFSVGHA